MKTYYMLPESSWGDMPQVNLNRYDCDTYFAVEDGKLKEGFVFCKFGLHQKPEGIDAKAFLDKYLEKAYSISKTDYDLAFREHMLS